MSSIFMDESKSARRSRLKSTETLGSVAVSAADGVTIEQRIRINSTTRTQKHSCSEMSPQPCSALSTGPNALPFSVADAFSYKRLAIT